MIGMQAVAICKINDISEINLEFNETNVFDYNEKGSTVLYINM